MSSDVRAPVRLPVIAPRRATLAGNFVKLLALLVATGLLTGRAPAQETPPVGRPFTLVVPFAAGGGTDTLARSLGTRLQAALGQPVVIENRPGANGAMASRSVLAQPPDGQTLLFGSYSTHVIAPLVAKQPAEAATAVLSGYTAVAVIGYAPLALEVNAPAPARTLAQFLDAARARPTTFGTFGIGSSAHLMGEIIAARSQAQLLHVPYKGSAPATVELMGGHVDSVILTVSALQPLVAGGSIRALAVSSKARMPALPQVPTLAEAGYHDLPDTGWFAVFLPAKAPAAAATRLTAALRRIVAEPDFRARLTEQGLEPVDRGAEDAQQFWQRSIESARAALKRTRVELD